jgi:sugar-specific transcriptional regulator TrmB
MNLKSNFDNSNQYDYNIEEYYKKWEEYFKSISKEWYVEMEKEIDRIYEYYPSIHEFLKSNRCESLLNFLYNKIFN